MHQPMSVAAAKMQSNAWHFSVKSVIDRIVSLALKWLSAIHSGNSTSCVFQVHMIQS